MSMFVESKFKIDYKSFETLPNQMVENIKFIKSRICQEEHLIKLQKQIDELQLSLAAETKMIADDVLRQNVFPRFNGYSDFIGHEFVTQETIDNCPTFGNLATAIGMTTGNFKDESKIHEIFDFMLENFIWLFFEGCGTWKVNDMKHVVIDYSHRIYVSGSNAYPSEFSYFFNATNANNGKTYCVSFTFYDLKQAIDRHYMNGYSDDFSPDGRCEETFKSLRMVDCGKILCTIFQIGKSKNAGDIPEPKTKVYIKSFDPLEISAFIKHVVFDNKGEINE